MSLCQTKTVLLLVIWGAFGASSCAQENPGSSTPAAPQAGTETARGVSLVGRMAHPRLKESSGVTASRQFPGILWTHNDGGGGRKQRLYAITRDGASVAEFPITGVLLGDWEDIAIDDARHLFIADVGNNDRTKTELLVHRIDEPDPKSGAGSVEVKRSWRLSFPAEPFDCESFFVWRGHGYLVSKVTKDARATIYRFPLLETTGLVPLEYVATTKIQSPVAGADLSPDGKLLALVAKSGAFVYRIDGEVARAGKGKPFQTKFRNEQIEGCCFVPEGLLATSESREIYLFTDDAFRWK